MKRWLTKWHDSLDPHIKDHQLTNDTYKAMINSLTVMPLLIKDLFVNYKPEYILTSKFQSDQLERRFAKYRTVAGNEYRVSQQTVEQSEKKLRDRHMIQWTKQDSADLTQDLDETEVTPIIPPAPEILYLEVSGQCSVINKFFVHLSIIT